MGSYCCLYVFELQDSLLPSSTGILTAVQRQTAVTAYLQSKQLLLFVFELQDPLLPSSTGILTAVQRQTAVTAYLESGQLLLFVFEMQDSLLPSTTGIQTAVQRQTAVTAYFTRMQLLLFALDIPIRQKKVTPCLSYNQLLLFTLSERNAIGVSDNSLSIITIHYFFIWKTSEAGCLRNNWLDFQILHWIVFFILEDFRETRKNANVVICERSQCFYFVTSCKRQWHNVGLILGHCLRRWPNISPTLMISQGSDTVTTIFKCNNNILIWSQNGLVFIGWKWPSFHRH